MPIRLEKLETSSFSCYSSRAYFIMLYILFYLVSEAGCIYADQYKKNEGGILKLIHE